MRCAYCHNPDTWAMTGGTMMEPEEIFEQYQRNKDFIKTEASPLPEASP